MNIINKNNQSRQIVKVPKFWVKRNETVAKRRSKQMGLNVYRNDVMVGRTVMRIIIEQSVPKATENG